MDFYKNSTYFHWGSPVLFFNYLIDDEKTFYILLFLIFIHQLITNWIFEVTYPWIINTLQNQRHTTINHSKIICLGIVNFNSLYNQIHLAFIISGMTSQFSFLLSLVLADFITLTYINWQYIKNKIVEFKN